MKNINIFDVVATLKPIPFQRLSLVEPEYESLDFLPTGQVGTIVEVYNLADNYHYLIEFADEQGREYAMAHLTADEFLVLHYELRAIA